MGWFGFGGTNNSGAEGAVGDGANRSAQNDENAAQAALINTGAEMDMSAVADADPASSAVAAAAAAATALRRKRSEVIDNASAITSTTPTSTSHITSIELAAGQSVMGEMEVAHLSPTRSYIPPAPCGSTPVSTINNTSIRLAAGQSVTGEMEVAHLSPARSYVPLASFGTMTAAPTDEIDEEQPTAANAVLVEAFSDSHVAERNGNHHNTKTEAISNANSALAVPESSAGVTVMPIISSGSDDDDEEIVTMQPPHYRGFMVPEREQAGLIDLICGPFQPPLNPHLRILKGKPPLSPKSSRVVEDKTGKTTTTTAIPANVLVAPALKSDSSNASRKNQKSANITKSASNVSHSSEKSSAAAAAAAEVEPPLARSFSYVSNKTQASSTDFNPLTMGVLTTTLSAVASSVAAATAAAASAENASTASPTDFDTNVGLSASASLPPADAAPAMEVHFAGTNVSGISNDGFWSSFFGISTATSTVAVEESAAATGATGEAARAAAAAPPQIATELGNKNVDGSTSGGFFSFLWSKPKPKDDATVRCRADSTPNISPSPTNGSIPLYSPPAISRDLEANNAGGSEIASKAPVLSGWARWFPRNNGPGDDSAASDYKHMHDDDDEALQYSGMDGCARRLCACLCSTALAYFVAFAIIASGLAYAMVNRSLLFEQDIDWEKELNVAFIGNSYLFINDIPRLTEAVSGYHIHQNSVIRSGGSLSTILAAGNGMYPRWKTDKALMTADEDGYQIYDYGLCTVRQILTGVDKNMTYGNAYGSYYNDGKNPCISVKYYGRYINKTLNNTSFDWDYVVLVDQTKRMAVADARETSIKALTYKYGPMIKQSGAVPVIVDTHSFWTTSTNMTGLEDIPTFQKLIYEGVNDYVDALSSVLPRSQMPIVAPVGLAYLTIWEEDYELWQKLFMNDGMHASTHGSYLLAIVLYTTLYGHLPQEEVSIPDTIAYLFADSRKLISNSYSYPSYDEAEYMRGVARRVAMQNYVPKALR